MSYQPDPTQPLSLDPNSERYRVCPECQMPFMAAHLLSKFCCNKHRNAFNNRRKRIEKKQKANFTVETTSQQTVSEAFEKPIISENNVAVKQEEGNADGECNPYRLFGLLKVMGLDV